LGKNGGAQAKAQAHKREKAVSLHFYNKIKVIFSSTQHAKIGNLASCKSRLTQRHGITCGSYVRKSEIRSTTSKFLLFLPYSPNLNPIERVRRATMEVAQKGKY
jgi:hypothetical protein